ncbi:MAG: pyruvate formate-lyase-activating protein [Lachnospiraceae bacterium]|nr:pyruvate formate-lyase-activating protein [Lachnospiraceae bacterium]
MIRSGYVHSFETFGSVDGPGIRFVVFLSGCAMRCQYCHNPDTWNMQTGKKFTPKEILESALKYRPYWGKDGGITVSGGEPLLQIDFVTELFRLAKEKGVHTTLDTAGGPYSENPLFQNRFQELMKYTDMVLIDIKELNSERHKELTGIDNAQILAMARHLSDLNKPMWIRHVLVPERTDFDEDLSALQAFINSLHCVEKVEVLPYHTLGVFKWEDMGMEYPLVGIEPPTKTRVENAKKILGCIK